MNLYVLCFNDDGPDTGPDPIRQEDLIAVFNPSDRWNVATIEPAAFSDEIPRRRFTGLVGDDQPRHAVKVNAGAWRSCRRA